MKKTINRKGSALLTVIIVVCFLTIITTTILYVSGMNYYMKATDLKTKESFYETEAILEQCRASLAECVSECAYEAHAYALSNFANSSDSTRTDMYAKQFIVLFEKKWNSMADIGTGTPDYLKAIKDLVPDASAQNAISLDSAVTDCGMFMYDASDYKKGGAIKGVVIENTSSNGHTGMIETELVIAVPDYSFSFDESSKVLLSGAEMSPKDVKFIDYIYYSNYIKK